ncbi:hypothetical protein [Magnetospirillum sp. XM-1]|uniref:hypothetical protein n=1 Tax=Magnetospirillum sp. XM-1 TaxID=1663591 RepID=UPI0012E397EA|nr:hypothetical protein [Magnetospirillum sp. XM-1]
MTTKIVLLLAAIMSVVTPAHAGMNFCTEPTEPACLSMLSMNLTELSFSSCKIQITAYLSSVDTYNECLIRDAKKKIQDKTNEANRVVNKFNYIVSGKSFCY